MEEAREQMVDKIRRKYGLKAPQVLSAMLQVPRHEFVDEEHRALAYRDGPIPIGCEQTMSQPYTVAFMTDLLVSAKNKVQSLKNEKVLEIGTGSGYQAAVLAELADEVYSMEIIPELAGHAKKTLKDLGYKNVHVKAATGEHGWKEKAPYGAIMVTAGIEGEVPEELFEQLNEGGVLVAPIGKGHDKQMTRFIKRADGEIKKEEFGVFHFVPFVEEGSAS